MKIWQVAAGDGNRDYSDVFLEFGVILVGPGSEGSYLDNPDAYNNQDSESYRPFIQPFAEGIAARDLVVLKRPCGQQWEVLAVGEVISDYEHREFFGRLVRALPGYHVVPQVSFGAFLTDSGAGSKDARWRLRASFDRKIADFLVCDKNMRVLAIIELDDETHNWVRDAKRDSITRAAGYTTIRFNSSPRPNCAEIADRVHRAVSAVA